MYYKYFNLSGPPFAATGSPAALFLGAGHREAMAALQWGLREPSGFTMLVGEVGAGKTTLLHSLLANSRDCVRIAFITNPTLSFEEILRLIAEKLGLAVARVGKLELIGALDSFIDALGPHESVALIFDEAQDLSDQTLEELRLLSNPQGPAPKRLQIVLVGQLELARRLERPEFRQLNQRIGARALLPTLPPDEIGQYIEYRLRAHGGDLHRIFRRGAAAELARLSGGIPRRINMLCHNAMMLAYAREARRVEVSHVREAARDYDHLLTGSLQSCGMPKRRARGPLIKTAAAVCAGAAALGLLHLVDAGALGTIESVVASKVAPSSHSRHQAPETRPAPSHYSDGEKCGLQPGSIDNAMPPKVEHEAPVGRPLPSTGKVQPAPAAVLPVATAQPPAVPEPDTVVVRSGDTLSKIALRRFASAAPDQLRHQVATLIKSNPEIADADRIYPGQIIHLKKASQGKSGGVSE